jgi:hypothetical protein
LVTLWFDYFFPNLEWRSAFGAARLGEAEEVVAALDAVAVLLSLVEAGDEEQADRSS